MSIRILEVVAEGGSISLLFAHGESCPYELRVNDSTSMLIGEGSVVSNSLFAETWDEALRLLDTYPWTRLRPAHVDPFFAQEIWQAVLMRLDQRTPPRRVAAWRSATTDSRKHPYDA